MKNLTVQEYNDMGWGEPEKYIKDVIATIEFKDNSVIVAGDYVFDYKDGFFRLWFQKNILAQWKLYFFQGNAMKQNLVDSVLVLFHR